MLGKYLLIYCTKHRDYITVCGHKKDTILWDVVHNKRFFSYMAIFFATYRTFEQFFPLLFILKKNFSTWNAAIYLNFHYFLFFTNCEKESTLTHTVLEKRLRYLQDTVLQCIFPKTHISLYC